ncbi:MAG: hypothetical protein QOC65_1220, partial [Sphingomonadales bacterium]|nr:hypothetical protein [Sphingomonadales bacterium]
MKDVKAKDPTSVDNAPRMTREETPAAAMAPVAAVAAATPKGEGTKTGAKRGGANGAAKKTAARKSAAQKGTAGAAAAKGKSATKATKPRAAKSSAKSSTRRAAARSASTAASTLKAPARPAVAKAAVAKPPVTKPVNKAPVKKPASAAPQKAADRKALPAEAAQAASTALQSALRGVMPSGGVIPIAQAALAPVSVALESGAEQARNAVGRARDTRESLQQAVAHSAAAAANGMLELNGKVIDLLRAQSDAAFELWRSTVTAGSLSEAVRVQTSGMRQAYEATTTHAKDVAEAATR